MENPQKFTPSLIGKGRKFEFSLSKFKSSWLALMGLWIIEPTIGEEGAWKIHVGVPGADGWRTNVIHPDPNDHGPDGINLHDWDGDGDFDVFVNYEEGGYSRLYFNPGKDRVRGQWLDFMQLPDHGNCEDSGIGDLDNDGDIDFVANGGHVFFNPGKNEVRNPARWVRMTLFKEEARTPFVTDIDGDGLNDLVVGADAWYQQPAKGKHDPANWKRHSLGGAQWPMNCILNDLDGDGDVDILVQERRKQGTFYYENPGPGKVTRKWPVREIDSEAGGMFMALGDMNGDGRPDLIKASSKVRVFMRINGPGKPEYKMIELENPKQPEGVKVQAKPKGVAILEMNGKPGRPEVVVIPEYEAQLWYYRVSGDGMSSEEWHATLMRMPAPESRKKMDNAFPADLDGDGDLDILTTEENGGWGVIWFENPER